MKKLFSILSSLCIVLSFSVNAEAQIIKAGGGGSVSNKVFPKSTSAVGQEFPIATGKGNTYAGGGAYDGTNYLMTIVGDSLNRYNITAQFISSGENLLGPRISTGKIGSGPVLAFDGVNFLMAWTDSFPIFASDTFGIGNIYGQFINTSGSLVGSTFTIVTDANIKFGEGDGTLVFNDTTYFITYLKGGHQTDHLYGQRISRSGNLIGTPIQISSDYARDFAVAFDGTNYLLAWCESADPNLNKNIYGQLVSKSGILVGENFLIDGGPYPSDNPVAAAFDGSRYLVAFHDQAANDTEWNLYAHFISTSGIVEPERITVCDSTKAPMIPLIAFGENSYLITWIETSNHMLIKGQFFNTTGVPLDTAFTVFDTLGGKFPFGGVSGFINGHFILGATRVDSVFSEAEVYGLVLDPITSGVQGGEVNLAPQKFSLSQNYPNPFNPSTVIMYQLAANSIVTLRIYDILGREITTLVQGPQNRGIHSVLFDASGLPSGVYFYRLQAGNFAQSKKLVVLR